MDIIDKQQQDRIWNILKSNKIWDVVVKHNYFNGRLYCFSARHVRIMARDVSTARIIACNNLEIIEEHMRAKRISGRRLIRMTDNHHLTANSIGQAYITVMLSGFVLTEDGVFSLMVLNRS